MLGKLKAAWRSYVGEEPQGRRILVDPRGARLLDQERPVWVVSWDLVEEVVACKVDALVVDHICLALRQKGELDFHVADEDSPGWENLTQALDQHFQIKWADGLRKSPSLLSKKTGPFSGAATPNSAMKRTKPAPFNSEPVNIRGCDRHGSLHHRDGLRRLSPVSLDRPDSDDQARVRTLC